MQAFRLTAPHTTELQDVEQPSPGAGEVLVRVAAAGACHSDLHIIESDDALGMAVPVTLGHENAGWVEALGPGVTGLERGQPVAVYGIVGCGVCVACLAGLDNQCRTIPPGGIGLSRDGGMAEYLVAPARQLLPVGDLDLAQAAPLTDAGLTPYHTVNACREGLVPGSTCVVIGVGGLGHMAIQILKATTAVRVIAVDVSDEALALAASLGADHPVASNPEAAGYIRDLVGPPPGGADVVIDCVGRQSTLDLAAAVVSTGGQIAIVGLGGGSLGMAAGAKVPWEVRVVNPFWGTRRELAEVIALARTGRIKAHVETFPLASAAEAYERLRAGSLRGRAVILPAAGRQGAAERREERGRAERSGVRS